MYINGDTKSSAEEESIITDTVSDCSLSPIPEFNSGCNRKHAAVEVTEDAARAIENQNNNWLDSEGFDNLNKLREEEEHNEKQSVI